jgi:hypothetical protein
MRCCCFAVTAVTCYDARNTPHKNTHQKQIDVENQGGLAQEGMQHMGARAKVYASRVSTMVRIGKTGEQKETPLNGGASGLAGI